MKAKEKWIEETMGSLDGIGRAPSDPHLFEKIGSRLKREEGVFFIQPSLLLKVAAGLALLISLNVVTLAVNRTSTTENGTTTENPLATSYFTFVKLTAL